MIDRVQLVAIAVSVVLLAVVLELVRRRKLVEEYSLLWILGSFAILALSIWRGMLDLAARQLGVFYPPSLLLLLVIVIVFVTLLWFSVVLSRQRKQIDRLMEETAILGAEIRDLRARDPGVTKGKAGGFAPAEPPTASLAGPHDPHSAPPARSRPLARFPGTG